MPAANKLRENTVLTRCW